jgi:hypothetical protein
LCTLPEPGFGELFDCLITTIQLVQEIKYCCGLVVPTSFLVHADHPPKTPIREKECPYIFIAKLISSQVDGTK